MSNADFSSNNRDDADLQERSKQRRVLELLREILPQGWQSRISPRSGHRQGASFEVTSPSGFSALLQMQFKSRFEPRDVAYLRNLPDGPSARRILVSPFLSARSRELLRQQNISHLDFNGNAWISTDSLFVERTGSDKAPATGAQRPARTSLRGPKTARIVRYLCDFREPLKVRDIAAKTLVNPGNVSRILELLASESFIERKRGAVCGVDWEALIARWAMDVAKDRQSEAFLEPHGLNAFNRRLKDVDRKYAVTGAFASVQLAPAAVPVAIDIYVANIAEFVDDLQLRRSERVGNVRLIEAKDGVFMDRTMNVNGFTIAAPSQIAADLLTLPKRSTDEYEALLAWMRDHEHTWRR